MLIDIINTQMDIKQIYTSECTSKTAIYAQQDTFNNHIQNYNNPLHKLMKNKMRILWSIFK